ncbi:MAG: DNA segregation ATPase FtsK/SpoIIIE, S-DNA-T family [Microgenomates group bacterium Gr01-1014_93]|nr:MAG: DNA segregation ATPase FtsK/SpoIIIE, S-DNA-T family [Microgenomates group bacterium Gr01-1014_93]
MARRSIYSTPKLKLKKKTIIAVGSLVAFCLAGVSLVSLVTDTSILNIWKKFLFDLFGWTYVISPLVFLLAALVLQKVKWPFAQTNVLLGLILLILSLVSITAFFNESAAGSLGVSLWLQLSSLVTASGAIVLLIGVFLVGIVVFFNTSLSQIFNIFSASFNFLNEKVFKLVLSRQRTFEAKNIPIKVSGLNQAQERLSKKAEGVMADELVQNIAGETKVWKYPPVNLLSDKAGTAANRGDIKKNAAVIEKTLDSFGVAARVAEVNGGPAVTQYALEISAGTKIAKIANLQHDLALALATPTGTVRVEAPIPGKSLVGIEVPNHSLEIVGLNLIDPKRVELTNYNNIPHLLTPVMTEPEKILSALKWAMAEMDRRYKLFQSVGVRNIVGYNEMSGFQALPYIVIIIDELADLMMFAPVEIEDAITRLAQMARATGIHLVVATQRPSVDVITGLIKANIPCRIAFNVSSMIDSRVIIDQPGAEKLLGRGDMLFLPPDASKPMRIQGVLLADNEINSLIKYLKDSGIAPQYTEEVIEMPLGRWGKGGVGGGGGEDQDGLFEEAVRTVCQYDRASASLLQRRLRVGYARAARIIDELEGAGIIGPGVGAKPRDVLVRNAEEYLNQKSGGEN